MWLNVCHLIPACNLHTGNYVCSAKHFIHLPEKGRPRQDDYQEQAWKKKKITTG